MTDKQIIIGGIDVSGCKYFDIISTHSELQECPSCKDLCKNNPNCLYKQLKRKEQECDELKNRRDEWTSKCEQETKLREFIGEQLDQLKQALAEIKEIAETCSFTDSSELLLCRIEQILQLINEVEDDRQD